MFQISRLFWMTGILSIAILSIVGCGQKRIHVATTSSTPGVEDELATNPDSLAALSDESGLEGSHLLESGLVADAEVQEPGDPDPSMFASESSEMPQSEDSMIDQGSESPESKMSEEFAGMIPPQQEIQTTPSSQSSLSDMEPNEESRTDDQLSQTALNGSPTQENTTALAENPEMTSSSQADSLVQDEGTHDTESPIEQVPDNIVVAKTEPSEAIQRQLEQMHEEEVATVAAGLQDVFFEFDSWTITPEGKDALEHDADWLKTQSSALILIEGHCDDRGTQAYNLVLGKKRAVAIRDYLVELGVDSSRLGFISYGKDKPFCSDPTEVCYQLNRRGRLVVQNP